MSYIYDASVSEKMYQNVTYADLHPNVQNTMKHGLHGLFTFHNATYQNGGVADIIDDIWMEIFYYLNFKSIIHISSACRHFHMLTHSKKYLKMHRYWKWKCKTICNDIEILNYETDDWYSFFISLYIFMKRFKYFNYFNDIHDYKLDCTYKHANKGVPITIGTHNIDFDTNLPPKLFQPIEPAHHTISLACIQDNIAVFKLLIKYIGNINDNIHHYGYDCYMSPLGIACMCNSCEIAQYLLNRDDIDILLCQTDSWCTPLWLATFYHSINIVELLLKHPKTTKESVNLRATPKLYMMSPLHCTFCPAYCASNPDIPLKIAQMLMSDKRTDPNSMDYPSKASPVYDAIAFPDYFEDRYRTCTPKDKAYHQLLENATQIAVFLIGCESVDMNMDWKINNKTSLELCYEHNQTKILSAIFRRRNKDRLMKLYNESIAIDLD